MGGKVREREIERYFRDKTKSLGGVAYKFVSPGNNGMPDRLAVLPGGNIRLVELKAPGETPTPLQLAQHRRLAGMGVRVYVLDTCEAVDAFFREWTASMTPAWKFIYRPTEALVHTEKEESYETT